MIMISISILFSFIYFINSNNNLTFYNKDFEIYQKNLVHFFILIVSILIIGFIGELFIAYNITTYVSNGNRIINKLNNSNHDNKYTPKGSIILELNTLELSVFKLYENFRKSYKSLKTDEIKYRTLVENIDNMIYSISPEGIVLSINKSFERVLKRNRNEVIGKHYKIFFNKIESFYFNDKYFKEAIVSKEKVVFNYSYIEEDITKYVLVSFIPLLNDKNEVIMIIGYDLDISELIYTQEKIDKIHENEKIKLEKILQKQKIELEKTMEELLEKEKLASLGSLVSGVAHEINTPIGTSLTTSTYMEDLINKNKTLILNGKLSKEKFITFIDNLEESSIILTSNLIKAAKLVTSFKKISVNQNHDEMQLFNLNEITNEVILSLKHEYKNTKTKILLNCDDSIAIMNFPGSFSQIITNLIMNTLKHGFTKNYDGIINIDIIKKDNKINIIYSDNGRGIEEHILPKIFNPFFTTNRNTNSSGLGLNIIYNIVTGQLNGNIKCTSIPFEKTSFIIEFPLNNSNIDL